MAQHIAATSSQMWATGPAEGLRRATALLLGLSSIAYVVWRAGFTLNLDHPVASALLLFADVLMLINGLGFVVSLWDLTPPPPAGEPDDDLSVVVWIPTYNEPVEILRRTILHAVAMDHPHETWVLDDGRRDEVRALADELGARYLTREDNQHAKAGNLNNALRQTEGDLIVSFDADFVPRRDFLTRLLGHFRDPRVALVQTPQRYYNLDSIQHGIRRLRRRLWGEQDSFFELILAGRNRWNAVYWIGTGAILRRSAIEEIGGFPTDSVVEDMLTGIGLHTRGWRSIYVDEPLALGLAPAHLGQFLIQRLRWARGAAQNLRLANPLFAKGLSLAQRLLYLSSIGHFFEGSARAIYYTLPALFLLFGIMPLVPDPTVLLVVHVYLVIQVLGTIIVSRGRISIVYDEVYSMIRFFTYLVGNLQVFSRRPIKFAVTPKGDDDDFSLRLVVGPLAVVALNGVALTVFLGRWLGAAIDTGSAEVTLALICAAWCGYFTYYGVRALAVCLSRPDRSGLAFHHVLPLVVESRDARRVSRTFCATRAWSDEQAVFWSDVPLYAGQAVTLTMHLPSGPISLDAQSVGDARLLRKGGRGLYEITVRYRATPADIVALVDASLRIAADAQYRRYRDGELLPWGSMSARGQFPIDIAGALNATASAVAVDERHLVLQTDLDVAPGQRGVVTLPWHHPPLEAEAVERVGSSDRSAWLVVLDRPVRVPPPFRARDLVEPSRGPRRRLSPSSVRQAAAGGVLVAVAAGLIVPILPVHQPPSRQTHRTAAMAAEAPLPPPEEAAFRMPAAHAAARPAASDPNKGAARQPRATIEPARRGASTESPARVERPVTGAQPSKPGPSIRQKTRGRALLEEHWRHVRHRDRLQTGDAADPAQAPRGRVRALPDRLDVDGDGLGGWDARGGTEFVVMSELQAYRMLQAVLLDDRDVFDEVWAFTRQHMQHAHIRRVVRPAHAGRTAAWVAPELLGRERDHLFARRWVPSIPVGKGMQDGVMVVDGEAGPALDGWTHASGADALIALSLVLAHERFGDAWDRPGGQYLTEARAILRDLWKTAVFEAGRQRYLAANRSARCIAPGDLMAPVYRVFAYADPDRDWMALVDSAWHLALEPGALVRGGRVDSSAGASSGRIGFDAAGEPAPCQDPDSGQTVERDASRALFWLALDQQLHPRDAHAAFFARAEEGGPDARVDVAQVSSHGSGDGGRPAADHYGAYSAFFSVAGALAVADELYAALTREAASDAPGFLRLGEQGVYWSASTGEETRYDARLNTWAWFEIARREDLFAGFARREVIAP